MKNLSLLVCLVVIFAFAAGQADEPTAAEMPADTDGGNSRPFIPKMPNLNPMSSKNNMKKLNVLLKNKNSGEDEDSSAEMPSMPGMPGMPGMPSIPMLPPALNKHTKMLMPHLPKAINADEDGEVETPSKSKMPKIPSMIMKNILNGPGMMPNVKMPGILKAFDKKRGGNKKGNAATTEAADAANE